MRTSKQPEDITLAKQALIKALQSGELSIGQAVKRMRQITGMNQKEYAKHIIGITPRILAEIERDQANPTVETLNKIGRPFGFSVGFVRKRP